MQSVTMPIRSSPFCRLVRTGALGRDFRGGRQCDAHHLLDEFRSAYAEAEQHVAARLADDVAVPELNIVRTRSILSEFVWGTLVRSRIACETCGCASDRLDYRDSLLLELPADSSACRLEELLMRFCSPDRRDSDLRCPAPAAAQCAVDARVTRQYFLEKEPSVLVMQLRRTQRFGFTEWKLNNDVGFPEILTCMRSGDYHFAGAVRHVGSSVHEGHYISNCWLGGNDYAEINCAPCEAKRFDWSGMAGIGRQVYILIYVRMSFRDVVGDGSEATPYARYAASVHLAEELYRGEPR